MKTKQIVIENDTQEDTIQGINNFIIDNPDNLVVTCSTFYNPHNEKHSAVVVYYDE